MVNQIIDSIRNKHELVFKVILFFAAISLVVFLLPKETKFKYEFQKNKPWVHQDLLAPFDFAINKTEEEIAVEEAQVREKHLLYFNKDEEVKEIAQSTLKKWVLTNWNNSLNIAGVVAQHSPNHSYDYSSNAIYNYSF